MTKGMKISVMDKKDSAIAISLAKFKELKDNLLITELDDVMRLCEEALEQTQQSIVEHDNKVIERCAKYCDAYYAEGVGNTIRELKGDV